MERGSTPWMEYVVCSLSLLVFPIRPLLALLGVQNNEIFDKFLGGCLATASWLLSYQISVYVAEQKPSSPYPRSYSSRTNCRWSIRYIWESGSQELLSTHALTFSGHTYNTASPTLADYMYSTGFILSAQLLNQQLCKLWVYVWIMYSMYFIGSYVPEGLMISCTWDYVTYSPANRSYTMILCCCVFFIPLIIIFHCYLSMFLAIRRTGR